MRRARNEIRVFHIETAVLINPRFCIASFAIFLLLSGGTARGEYLKFVGTVTDGVEGVDGLDGASMSAISPDGKHVYVASALDDAVAVFSRSAGSGTLTFLEQQRDGVGGVDGLDAAYSVDVSPDGKHVYAVGQIDDSVVTFVREPSTGKLSFIEKQTDGVSGVDGLASPKSVVVSPDGKNVYVASFLDAAIAVFERDATVGKLQFIEVHRDGVGAVDGLEGAFSVAISPDGGNVYAASEIDDAIAVFYRDAATGRLTFVEEQRDGVNGVDGLDFVMRVTVSADGKNVYTAANLDDAVAVFKRDAITGQLTFVERQKNGASGVSGLDSAHAVVVSPDGQSVYAAGRVESDPPPETRGYDSVVVFTRDANTGRLTYVEHHRDGVGGIDGLYGVSGPSVSADSRDIYFTGGIDDAVTHWRLRCGDGAIDAGDVCDDGNILEGDGCSSGCGVEAGFQCTGEPSNCTRNATATPTVLVTATTTMQTTATAEVLTTPTSQATEHRTETPLATALLTGSPTPVSTPQATASAPAVCPPTPQAICKTPAAGQRSTLTIVDRPATSNDSLLWRWLKGSPTSKNDFGLPELTTAYALCIYRSDTPARLVFSATIAGGQRCGTRRPKPCWKETRTGFKYTDRDGIFGGVQSVLLQSGAEPGKAKIAVVGKGVTLGMLRPSDLHPPIVVELSNSEGRCWGTTFSFPARIDDSQFKAKADPTNVPKPSRTPRSLRESQP